MKRAVLTFLLAWGVIGLEEALATLMVRGDVASSLLGSPTLSAAALAASFVVVRVLAVVIAPGLILASLALALAAYFRGSSSGAGISVGADGGVGATRAGLSK